MKIYALILLPLLFIVLGCSQKSKGSNSDYEKEILSLKTDEEKANYLMKIIEDDQGVRDGAKSADLMLRFGKDSPEFMEYVEAQWAQDEINLSKIEKYLEIHGYPKKEMGEDAITAPWMVIHHTQNSGARERHFEIVYEAYLNGDIDDGAISFYLGRMYQKRYGERLKMESPYKAEDEINQLIKYLDLEEKKARVLQKVAR